MSARGCQLTRETTGPCRAAAAHSITHGCAGQTPSKADGASALGLQEAQTAAQAQPNLWCNQQDLDYGTPGKITGYLTTFTSGEERRGNVLYSLRRGLIR